MKITKVINNNVVSSLDVNDKEIVVMGRGVGFQKSVNDEIDETLVQKIFCLSDDTYNKFEELVKGIPYENILLAEKIISYASDQLHCHLNKNIYITLTDHLNYAIERQQNGYTFENALLWEIKKFYNSEYAIGLKALELVKEELGVELSEDEAGFLALHIVNAEIDGDMKHAIGTTSMIKDILNIIRYTFDIEFDESSLAYERMVTHIKFFVHRLIRGECYDAEDEDFNKMIENKYFKEYNCALRIKDYFRKKANYNVSDEELIYLTTHIYRVLKTSKKQ